MDPIGLLTINNGSYSQSNTGTLQIDLGGETPNAQYDVFSVSGNAALNGRLILSATNGFLPASGDVFNVMTYASHSGEFATIDHGAGLAFGPEYQSGGVVISDNPTLIELSQKPDRRTAHPEEANGFTVRALNPTTQTITVTLNSVLPIGFRYLDGTLTSNLDIGEPITSVLNDVQTMMWPQPFVLAPNNTFTLHFSVAMTTTPNLYVNQVTLALTTPTTLRTVVSRDTVVVAVAPFMGTQIKAFYNSPFVSQSPAAGGVEMANAVYPPLNQGDPYRLLVKRGTDLSRVLLDVRTSVLCPASSCGDLRRVLYLQGALIVGSQIMPPVPFTPTQPVPLPPLPLPPPKSGDPIVMLPIYGPPPDGGATGGPAGCATLAGALSLDLESGDTFYCPPPFIELYLTDPSGYVTDASTGAPIRDATVTLYRVPSALPDTRTTTRECRTIDTRPDGVTGTWNLLPPATPNLGMYEDPAFSPPAIDPPINPLKTDETGYYGWDVIRGCWYVKVEAPGYFTKYSAVVGVPPEVTDLHLQLTPLPPTLSVHKTGNGAGVVTSADGGIACGADCAEEYQAGTPVTLTATADTRSEFTGWSGACTGVDACTVTMHAATEVTATFALKRFPLLVQRSGLGAGLVTSVDGGIVCGADCAEEYLIGTVVTLTAAVDVGSVFDGWSGACEGSDVCTVTMNANSEVQAIFSMAAKLQSALYLPAIQR